MNLAGKIYIMKTWIFLAIALLIIWIVINSRDISVDSSRYDLKRDGVQIYKSIISEETRKKWETLSKTKNYKQLKSEMQQHPRMRDIVQSLGKDYDFQDYVLVIEKSAVHTCHRDYNGTFSNPNQKHKSYTIIVYLETMEKCLGVIPGSQESKYSNALNLKNNVRDLLCSERDAILFDANLIHVGTINNRDDNLRVQMKITHRDDLEALSYYEKYNRVLNKDNTNPHVVRKLQRQISCTFPYLADATQMEGIKSSREGAEPSLGQKLFSYVFYGRSDFYELPNAF